MVDRMDNGMKTLDWGDEEIISNSENGSLEFNHSLNFESRTINKGTSQKGLREGWTRMTVILRQEHVEKLKALSYWDRVTIKEIMEEALFSYLKNKEVKIFKKRETLI